MSLALLLLLFAQDVPLAAAVVPDRELATQRGGFELPGGIDVALTVQTQTSVNGAIVLRTVFRADHGPATLVAYAPRPGETVAAAAGGAASARTAATVSYDSRTGILVIPAAPAASVQSGSIDDGAGLQQVDAAAGAITDNGVITQAAAGGRDSVELRGDDLSITHLAGTAFGSAIANSGSDRAIDTQTTVGIDLHNAGATMLASAALRVEDVANAAMGLRQ